MFNLAGLLCVSWEFTLSDKRFLGTSHLDSPSVFLASAEMVESWYQPWRAPPKAHSTKAAKGKGQGTSTLLRAPPKWHTFLPFHSHGPGFPGKPTPSCQGGGRCIVAGQPELFKRKLVTAQARAPRVCSKHSSVLSEPQALAGYPDGLCFPAAAGAPSKD